MENRLITSKDGMTWMDVTDIAKTVWNSGLFPLYEYMEKGDKMVRLPIEDTDHLLRVLDSDNSVVIKVGQNWNINRHEHVTMESWVNADKIQYNGFIYVRYADLKPCR
jgi:hypothetical protein